MLGPKFSKLILATLHRLYHASAFTDTRAYTAAELSDLFEFQVGRGIVEQALIELTQKSWADSFGDNIKRYYITSHGILKIEELLSTKESELKKYISRGDNWILDHEIDQEDGEDERSEEVVSEWFPLPLERQGEQYELAIECSENALEVIQGDNGYSASTPEERDQVVWSIQSGIRSIKEGFPNRPQVISLLLNPLKFIANKFSGAAMGETAKAAVRAISVWLGLV